MPKEAGRADVDTELDQRRIEQKRLVLVEYNPGFCALLRDRYPQATVVQGDAYALRDSLWDVLSATSSRSVSTSTSPRIVIAPV